MDQVKKKQHYVWKEYLKPWCTNERIFAYLKSSKKTIHSNLDGVVQERFYYSLEEFTIEEELILKELVEKFSIPDVVNINMDFYTVLISYSRIKRELKKKYLPEYFKRELDEKLNILQKNCFEDIQMRIEMLGKNLIISNSIAELNNLFKNENRFMSFAFICMQYHRTKKRRLAYQEYAKSHNFLKEKYTDVISVIFANNLAWVLTFNQKCNIVLLLNKTNTPLLTSDQPAINSRENEKNEDGHIDKFELYYPLSPNHALLIQIKEKEEDNSLESHSMRLEEVEKYNKQIFDAGEAFVFGLSNSLFLI